MYFLYIHLLKIKTNKLHIFTKINDNNYTFKVKKISDKEGESVSKEFMKLHHNNMDIASKSLELQTIGIEPLGFLGKKYGVVEQMLSNEFPGIETKDDKADIVFLLKNNSILHIEFQSTYKKSDVFRFCKYHLELYNRHKNQIESEDGIGHIRTVVVYMPNIKKRKC